MAQGQPRRAAGEEFTSETESVRDNPEERADAASTRVKISTYLSLVDSGVIPPEEVPDSFFNRGLLVSTSDVKTEHLGDRAQQAMNGVNDYASTEDIEEVFMREFRRY